MVVIGIRGRPGILDGIPRTRRVPLRPSPTGKLEEVIFQRRLLKRDLGVPDVEPCERGQELGDMPLVNLDVNRAIIDPSCQASGGRLTQQVIETAFHT